MSKEEQADLLDCLLETGQQLLESGAEISRVEDTISRIAKAYGVRHIDVFVITSIISISLEFSGTDFVSETRRIYSSSDTDFSKLEKLNSLSRAICREPISLEDFHSALNDIASMSKPFWLSMISG